MVLWGRYWVLLVLIILHDFICIYRAFIEQIEVAMAGCKWLSRLLGSGEGLISLVASTRVSEDDDDRNNHLRE